MMLTTSPVFAMFPWNIFVQGAKELADCKFCLKNRYFTHGAPANKAA